MAKVPSPSPAVLLALTQVTAIIHLQLHRFPVKNSATSLLSTVLLTLALIGIGSQAPAQTPACQYPSVGLHPSSPFNVLWTLWDPSVIWNEHAQKFHLTYTRWNGATQHMHVYGTESVDGITWPGPVRDLIDPTDEGAGWGQGVIKNFETTSLVQVNETTFYLYFLGYTQVNRVDKIGLAISTDSGQTYQVYHSNPVLVPTQAWEVNNAVGVKEPSVIWDKKDELFKMWYNVTTTTKNTRVGYAWSTDGINWTKHTNNPVMDSLPVKTGWEWAGAVNHVNVVQDPHFGYHLFYANHFAIGQAYSPNGVNWTRDPAPTPMIDFSFDSTYQIANGTWEFVNLEAYGSPAAIFKNNQVLLFHMRTLPGAYKYGRASKLEHTTNPGYFGMNLGLATGTCLFQPDPPTPQNLIVRNISDDTASLHWTRVPEANQYHIRQRPVGTSTWWEGGSINNLLVHSDTLTADTEYEYQVRSSSPYGVSDWTDLNTYETLAAGSALSLQADTFLLSRGQASTQNLSLDAGVANANRLYWIFGNLAGNGSVPGVQLGSVNLPLNPDPWTQMTVNLANTPSLQQSKGSLDALGQASASLNTLGPQLAAPLGLTLQHCYLVYSTGSLDFYHMASNLVSWTVTP